MSSELTMEYFRSQGLLPFQAEFARDFCAPQSPPYWELVAPVGTGKTFLATIIVSNEMKLGAKRILVLVPRALLYQWQDALRSSQGEAYPLLVNRRTYLELEANTPVRVAPWPERAVILMSIDLAKRDDMALSLSRVDWDLLVIDESNLLTGRRRKLVEQLQKEGRVKRALLLTSTPIKPLKGVKRRVISGQELTDWNGEPLFKVRTRRVLTVEYNRTDEEREFLREFEQFAIDLQKKAAYGRLQGAMLRRAASSSIFALESMLRRLMETWRPVRNRIAHGMNVTLDDLKDSQHLLFSAVEETDLPELAGRTRVQHQNLLGLFQNIERLLDRIGEISSDSKLDALRGHLTETWHERGKKFLCVWTSFVTTVQYLTPSLEDLGIPMFSLTGASSADTRQQSIEEFRTRGGILLTTDVASDERAAGFALGYVDECVNYDLPQSRDKLEQRWGRFLRVSRTTDFEMVWLRDSSKSLAWEERVFGLLETRS